MSPRQPILALLVLLGLAVLPAHAAESYDNCTGFIDSLPTTISTQGVWCLRGDLATGMTSGTAITIATNNVTIDCNDFKIGGLAAGDSSQASGIRADSRLNATVRRCNARGFFMGINLVGGAGHLVEDNRLDNNLYMGIHVTGEQNRVLRNLVFDTGGTPDAPFNGVSWGIYANADIIDNTVSGVYAVGADTFPRGIYVLEGSGFEVRGNRIRRLVVDGSGTGFGIITNGTDIVLADNRVRSAVAGYGIIDNGATDAVCIGNTVSGFGIAFSNCINGGGNASN